VVVVVVVDGGDTDGVYGGCGGGGGGKIDGKMNEYLRTFSTNFQAQPNLTGPRRNL
jgi:hypothetical protein